MEIHKPGRVTKIVDAGSQEKAQIEITENDTLCGEIRIANTLHDPLGKPVHLSEGDNVELVIRTDEANTELKR